MDNLTEMNLYELLNISQSATVQEIKTAYRKKALSCHPDKNPDNPRAAELFHELSRVLEILTDESARAAYDKVLTAREQAKIRVKEYDAKRRKLKEDLEAREEAYKKSQSTKYDVKTDEQKLKAEIERLRKEGSRQVEEEKAFVERKIWEQLHGSQRQGKSNPGDCRIKIRWKAEENDPQNGGYSYDTLHRILSKYGDITALVISASKKGRAIVEFEDKSAAEMAVKIETGLIENPLVLKGFGKDKGSETVKETRNTDRGPSERIFPAYKSSNESKPNPFVSFPSAPDIFNQRKVSDAEFESSVLSNLRRAEERKRIIEQLQTEEGT